MKVRRVRIDRRRKAFEVIMTGKCLFFPFARLEVKPRRNDPIVDVCVDKELASEGFTYTLRSGKEGSVLADQVLDYNSDPDYLRDLLLYRLSVEAQKRLAKTSLAKREIIRRLGTSASQFYRLVDQTNYTKSVDQMLRLLQALDCDVELVVRTKSA